MPAKPTARLALSIDPEVYEMLAKASQQEGRTKTAIIEDLICEYAEKRGD